ncbi:hypothetical protein [Chroococcidiopsis sp.]|uniref:hypothetical protein n=1 Tax=Chroococcidiopsis sp. TaxID=3088168 RepID=UPI003F3C4FB5
MKPTYSIVPFSGANNFLPINVASITSTAPTALHTCDAVNFDEVWLNAYNYSTSDAVLTVQLGGSASHQKLSIVVPSGRGLVPVLTGQTFSGSAAITAYASTANAIALTGRINRIIFI